MLCLNTIGFGTFIRGELREWHGQKTNGQCHEIAEIVGNQSELGRITTEESFRSVRKKTDQVKDMSEG